MNVTDTERHAADVEHWYNQYLATFRAMRAGTVTLTDLASFYVTPLWVLSSQSVQLLRDQNQVIDLFRGFFDRLDQADFATSIESDRAIRVLNARTAIVAITLDRRNTAGETLDKVDYEYLVADTDEGRRILVLTEKVTGQAIG